jgi:uncharacterized protein (DUF1015 family)
LREDHSPAPFADAIQQRVARIAPFRGIRYDPDAVGDLSRVVAPPYDVISDAALDLLEEASPHNIVRLILGRDEPGDDETTNKYTRARGLLEAWLTAGVLRRDEDEALYVYEERSTIDGEPHLQRGILGAVSLGREGEDAVLPHEGTYDDIVADRLALLRATATNLDCIFCVTDAQDAGTHAAVERVTGGDPSAAFTTPDGIDHRLWTMTDPDAIATVIRTVSRAQVVIADGHHRHRTAQIYADERRGAEGPGPWDAQLMLVVDATRFGPALLPIHRVVRGIDAPAALARLQPVFRVEEVHTPDPAAMAAELIKRRIYGRTFAMLSADRAWWLTVSDKVAEREAMPPERSPAWRDLDVAVLHALVFDRLLDVSETGFEHSATETADAVRAGRADLAFLVAPPPFESVRAVAEAGEAMPQKSTFFIPKPITGIVLRPLDT